MRDTLARIAVVVLAGFGLGGCGIGGGGVAVGSPRDAASSGPRKPGDPDAPMIVINLDVAGEALAATSSCIEIDGGLYCVSATCGNGIPEGTEECDDRDNESGDGCTAECKLEDGWACPIPGEPCVSTVVCGDGRVSGNEVCDDHNLTDNDGCSADCSEVTQGWVCLVPGMRCQPKCGDGVLVGEEQCDDGNAVAGDGCSSACVAEPGFACPEAGKPCHPTVCGDKKKEGSESCDDGNTVPGDGCATDCRSEPACKNGQGCTSPCGDGLKLPEEECDDGNLSSNDGCSSTCKLEPGWACEQKAEVTTKVPVIFRDMLGMISTSTDPPPHPNFELQRDSGGLALGMVKDLLDSDGKPEYNPTVDPGKSVTTTAEDFKTWYRDSKYSKTVIDTLPLVPAAGGTFVYDHSGVFRNGEWVTPAFFPLDGRGWSAPPNGPEIPTMGRGADGELHDFYFTSEVRYWFEFQGGESLSFIGDDDVWVFLNGMLAVDLGGIHGATPGAITLDATTAATFKLTKGKIYEIVVFQAERHLYQSSYKLTLGQFSRTRTVCSPRCGDGVVNGAESCDKGAANSDTEYGGCTTKCVYGPYCGDGNIDASGKEECDDGKNNASYGQTTGCLPACRIPHYCGDGKVDSLYGEECDNGPGNGNSLCTLNCKGIVP